MPAPRMTIDEYLRLPETLAPEELVYGFVRNEGAIESAVLPECRMPLSQALRSAYFVVAS